MLLPRTAPSWARKHGGPAVTLPHRSRDSTPPRNAPWVRGHYCYMRGDVQTVSTYQVSTDLT